MSFWSTGDHEVFPASFRNYRKRNKLSDLLLIHLSRIWAINAMAVRWCLSSGHARIGHWKLQRSQLNNFRKVGASSETPQLIGLEQWPSRCYSNNRGRKVIFKLKLDRTTTVTKSLRMWRQKSKAHQWANLCYFVDLIDNYLIGIYE